MGPPPLSVHTCFTNQKGGPPKTGFRESVFQTTLIYLKRLTLCLTIQRSAGNRIPKKSWSLNLLKNGWETRFLRNTGHQIDLKGKNLCEKLYCYNILWWFQWRMAWFFDLMEGFYVCSQSQDKVIQQGLD